MGPCDPPGTPYVQSRLGSILNWLPVEVALTLTAWSVVDGVVGVLDCCGCRDGCCYHCVGGIVVGAF